MMNAKTFVVEKLEDLSAVSDYLIEMSSRANVIAFFGPMGAGKTTLIKNLCHKRNVTDEVNSPTFAIVNEYLTNEGESIFHFDFYRIKKLEEAYDIGYENYFFSNNMCLVEWPEMIEPLMPDTYIKVEIIPNNENETRLITCSLITC